MKILLFLLLVCSQLFGQTIVVDSSLYIVVGSNTQTQCLAECVHDCRVQPQWETYFEVYTDSISNEIEMGTSGCNARYLVISEGLIIFDTCGYWSFSDRPPLRITLETGTKFFVLIQPESLGHDADCYLQVRYKPNGLKISGIPCDEF